MCWFQDCGIFLVALVSWDLSHSTSSLKTMSDLYNLGKLLPILSGFTAGVVHGNQCIIKVRANPILFENKVRDSLLKGWRNWYLIQCGIAITQPPGIGISLIWMDQRLGHSNTGSAAELVCDQSCQGSLLVTTVTIQWFTGRFKSKLKSPAMMTALRDFAEAKSRRTKFHRT